MLKADKYIEEAYKKLDLYIKGVQNNTIITNVYIKKEVENYLEFINSDKYWFNTKAFNRVIKFFSYININIREKYRQFDLQPFQVFHLADLFGVCERDTDIRKYTKSYLYVAKKSGKTPYAAVITLYMLILDSDRKDANIVLIANTSNQAYTALSFAQSIIRNSPYIKSLLTSFRDRIIFEKGGSKSWIKILSSNPNSVDSLSITSAILDEIGTYQNSVIFDKITTSTVGRINSMVLLISTAGSSVDSWGYKLLEYGKRVVMREVPDEESFLFMLYCLDDKDDWQNQDNWIKSNPGLETILPLKTLQQLYKTAVNFPSSRKLFLALNLNIYSDEITNWIPREEIKKCEYVFNEKDFLECDVYIGIDLSANRDLTSCSLLFDKDGIYYSKTYFFRANNPDTLIRKSGFNITRWIEDGYIYQMDTKSIDFDYLYDFILELNQKYNIISLGYDPFNSPLLIPRLETQVNCSKIPQNFTHFNFPLKYMEKLLLEQNLKIDENPCMLWNWSNVCLKQDDEFNIKIAKNKSKDAVDGVVALAMALHEYIRINTDPEFLNFKDMSSINMDELSK